MRDSGFGSAWAPSPVESLHARTGSDSNDEMYKTFMFKKTMVIVACLLAAVVLVAHWSSAVRFIMFLFHRSRRRRSARGATSDSPTSTTSGSRSVELFKAEQRDSDSKPLRPIQMVKYSAKPGGVCRRMGSECMICLGEFKSSEKVGLLPDCGHGFHRPCIEMWLFSHSNCPICRHSLMQHQDLDQASSPS